MAASSFTLFQKPSIWFVAWLESPGAQNSPIVVHGSPLVADSSCYVDSLRPQELEMIPGCAARLILATMSHSQSRPSYPLLLREVQKVLYPHHSASS